MENKKDALELVDIMIEEASQDIKDNSIRIGLVKVLVRVRARLEPEQDE